MSKELGVAIEAAKKAGKLLMRYYGKTSVRYKADGSVETEADIRSEKKIISILQKDFPYYSFLGEESGYSGKKSDYVWVIDPLDGTTNYMMMNPFFGVSIALVYRAEPILGVVSYPHEEEIFFAQKGKGAFLNDRKIHVSDEQKMKNSILTFAHGLDRNSVVKMTRIFGELKLITNKVRQIGAPSLQLCYVACGRTESFLMVGVNPYDVAAGAIIVKEANGYVTDFSGKTFSVNSKDILASNRRMHKEILQLLKETQA